MSWKTKSTTLRIGHLLTLVGVKWVLLCEAWQQIKDIHYNICSDHVYTET